MSQELSVSLKITPDAAAARKETQGLSDDLAGLQKSGDSAGGALKQQAAAVDRLASSLDDGDRNAQRLASAQRTLNTALTSGTITQERYNALLSQATARWTANDAAVRKNGVSAAQTTQAFRQLPAQITDIVTSLQGGQKPLTVLIQQGGQIKDSFGGIMPALRALAPLFTVSRIAIGGLLGVIASGALAYNQGSKEADAYVQSVTMSGNAAGVTAGRLADMAAAVDKVTGTQAQAADGLAQLASSGEVAAHNLERFTAVAIDMESAMGQSVATTVKNFTELGKAPLSASIKLNETLNYLTVTVYAQIKALQEQGRVAEAGELAQNAYANAMSGRVKTIKDNLGTLESAWKAVGRGAAEAWDFMLNIGRGDTLQTKLDKVTAEIEKARKPFNPSAFGDGNAEARAQLASNLQLQASLQEMQRLEKRGAEAQATRAAQVKARIEFDKEGEKYTDKATKLEDALTRARQQGAAAGATQQEIEARLKDIRAEFAKGDGNKAFQNASADAGVAMARLKADLGLLQDAIKTSDAVIEQALKDGSIDIQTAFDARLSQLRTQAQAERQALGADRAEIEQALAKAKTPAERGPLTKQGIEIDAKLRLLDSNLQEQSRQLGLWKVEQERQLATITAKVSVEVSALTGVFDRSAIQAQLRAQYDGELKAAGQLGDPAAQAAARARVEMLIQAGVAQAEFNAKLAEAQRLQAALGVQEEATNTLATQGVISQIEADARLREGRARLAPQLQEIVAQLQAMRSALPADAAVALDQTAASIGQLQNAAAAATPVVVDLGTRLRNTAIDGLADAAGNAVTNFKNMRTAISDTLKGIAGDIIKSGVKKALTDQFSASSSSSSGSGFLGTVFSGVKSLFGFKDGGHIRGPGTGTSDSIPALVGGVRPIAVSDNEFIQPERAVKKYGLGFMEAVRTLRLPKPQFAFGGLVQAHRQARFATGGQVTSAGGAAAAMPNVIFQLNNTGTAQRVADTSQSMVGKDLVVNVVLADLQNGGPIAQTLRRR